MQSINLDLDKENELVFKLSVEGTRAASVTSRFLIESDRFSLFFPAKSSSRNEVTVLVPPLDNVISEGNYVSSLEVIIDDKVFKPMNINTEFKKTVSVVAEVVQRTSKSAGPTVSSVVSVNSKQVDLSEEKVVNESNEIEKEENKNTGSQITESSQNKKKRPVVNRKRPSQRLGKRPEKSRMSKESNRRTTLENTVRELSKSEGAKLSEGQILKVVNFLNKRGSK